MNRHHSRLVVAVVLAVTLSVAAQQPSQIKSVTASSCGDLDDASRRSAVEDEPAVSSSASTCQPLCRGDQLHREWRASSITAAGLPVVRG